LPTLTLFAVIPGALAQGAAQKPVQGIGPWHDIKETPMQEAISLDAKLSALKNLRAEYKLNLDYGDKVGGSLGDVMVRDSKVFFFQFPYLHYSDPKKQPIDRLNVKSNGKLVDQIGGDFPRRQIPTAKFRLLTATSPRDWTFGLAGYTMASVLGEPSFRSLVAQASKPGSGWIVQLQQRTVVDRGFHTEQKLLRIKRRQAEADRKGPVDIRITIDVAHGLPVSSVAEMKEPSKPKIKVDWRMAWGRPNQPFPESLFKVDYVPPKSTQGVKTAKMATN